MLLCGLSKTGAGPISGQCGAGLGHCSLQPVWREGSVDRARVAGGMVNGTVFSHGYDTTLVVSLLLLIYR
jgi:hypothetical protein